MMWIQASALLITLCLWPTEAQRDGARKQSIWENPVKFSTKAKDFCTMIITGQGENTMLKVSCQGGKQSYWCEYMGKPHTCSPYNKNPRHYFVQMMWALRKLHNACEGPKVFKPHMCRKATDESQMIFTSASVSQSRPEPSNRNAAARQVKQRTGPQTRPAAPARPGSTRQVVVKSNRPPQRSKTTQKSTQQTTTPPTEKYSKKVAQQYCWRSLQGLCSFAVGLFKN